MIRFRPSFSFWPQPQFLGESRLGFAAWIIDRAASVHDEHDELRKTAIQRIIDNHHDNNGQTIEPPESNDV